MPDITVGHLAVHCRRGAPPPPACAIRPERFWGTDWSEWATRAAIEAAQPVAAPTDFISTIGIYHVHDDWALDEAVQFCGHRTLRGTLTGDRATDTYWDGGVPLGYYFNAYTVGGAPNYADVWLRQRVRWAPGFNFKMAAGGKGFNLGKLGGNDAFGSWGGLYIDGVDGRLKQWTQSDGTAGGAQATVDGGAVAPYDGAWYDAVVRQESVAGGFRQTCFFGPQGAPAQVAAPMDAATGAAYEVFYYSVTNEGGFNGPLGSWWIGSVELVDGAAHPDPFGLL